MADISASGVNPYHTVFRRAGWTQHPSQRIPGFPADAPALSLTFGSDPLANIAADAAAWTAYRARPGVVHWVPGTNLLLMTIRTPEGTPGYESTRTGYIVPNSGLVHSQATGSRIARTCADCYLLVIQDLGALDDVALLWITNQAPWVDFVSSTQFPNFGPETAAATKALHRSGRLFFGPSGNRFVNSVDIGYEFSDVSFPPWVVSVGGAQRYNTVDGAACNATFANAAKPTELVSDFLHLLPLNRLPQDERISGTSFSTPQLAAHFAQALLNLRQRLGSQRSAGTLWAGPPRAGTVLGDGQLTQEEMRWVFSRSARYFKAEDFNPHCVVTQATFDPIFEMPLPVTPPPWIEMGWGYVGVAETALATKVLLGEAAIPTKAALAADYMRQFFKLRRLKYPE